MSMLSDLMRINRSYRRFQQNFLIDIEILRELVELARLSASAANRQPLKYILSSDPRMNAMIYPHLTWAGYLKDWNGPTEGEKPSAYIIVLGDKEITVNFGCDHGIATQSILLGAVEKGLGGCIIGAVDHKGLREDLKIPERYQILHVIAVGKPAEKVVAEDLLPGGDIKYWRDSDGVHHVPKRLLQELILIQYPVPEEEIGG